MRIASYKPRSGKAIAGMILILVGTVILLDHLGMLLPSWLFSWPIFLIIWGLYAGARHDFKKPAAFIIIGIGLIFLVDKMFPSVNFSHIFWPLIFIGLGVFMILSKDRKNQLTSAFRNNWAGRNEERTEWDKKFSYGPEPLPGTAATNPVSDTASEDYIDSVSVFGGIKKNIMSKNFKGGDIVNFFGGAEINLIQADIVSTAVLDVTQVFGGTKIIVPPHWEVHSEMAAVFGGIEDKRPIHPTQENGKILIIRGTSIFGGIDIRSY